MTPPTDPLAFVKRETLLQFAAHIGIGECSTLTNDEIRRRIAENADPERLRSICPLDLEAWQSDTLSRVSSAEESHKQLTRQFELLQKDLAIVRQNADNASQHLTRTANFIGIFVIIGTLLGLGTFREGSETLRESRETLKNLAKDVSEGKVLVNEAKSLNDQMAKYSSASETLVMRRITEDARSEFPHIFADRIPEIQVARFVDISHFIESTTREQSIADSTSQLRLKTLQAIFRLLVDYGRLREPGPDELRRMAAEFERLHEQIGSQSRIDGGYDERFFAKELPAYIANIAGVVYLRAHKEARKRQEASRLDFTASATKNFERAKQYYENFANPWANLAVVKKYDLFLKMPDDWGELTDDQWKKLINDTDEQASQAITLLEKALKYQQSDRLRSVVLNNMADWSLTQGMIRVRAIRSRTPAAAAGTRSIESILREGMSHIKRSRYLDERDCFTVITEAELECMALAFSLSRMDDKETEIRSRLDRIVELIAAAVDRGFEEFPKEQKSLEAHFRMEDQWWHFALEKANTVGQGNDYLSRLTKAASGSF